MDENITPKVLPDGGNIAPADNSGAGSDADEVLEVKDLLKQLTGKEFPTNEAATKSLQDTYKWGTELSQKVKTLETENEALKQAGAVAPDLAKQVESLARTVQDGQFYATHPEFNTPAIKALITDMGGNPETVIVKDSFKAAAAALKTTSEMDASKSVLHTNPRLGQVQDTMTKASEALKAGNDQSAKDSATQAVMDAFGMAQLT